MTKSDPAPDTLQAIPFATFREELATVLNLVAYREQSFVVTRRDRPCAVLLPLSALTRMGLRIEDLVPYLGKAL